MAMRKVQSYRIATVQVPAIFWDDHVSRDLDFTSVEVSRNSRWVVVRMNDEALMELYSDADYYANFMEEFASDGGRSIVNSARSTIKALVRQGFFSA